MSAENSVRRYETEWFSRAHVTDGWIGKIEGSEVWVCSPVISEELAVERHSESLRLILTSDPEPGSTSISASDRASVVYVGKSRAVQEAVWKFLARYPELRYIRAEASMKPTEIKLDWMYYDESEGEWRNDELHFCDTGIIQHFGILPWKSEAIRVILSRDKKQGSRKVLTHDSLYYIYIEQDADYSGQLLLVHPEVYWYARKHVADYPYVRIEER